MPRPIIFTEKMKKQAREDFAEMLESIKMPDGKLNYSKSYKYETSNVTVWLTSAAYKKIVALVTEFSDEVGWHGSVTRSKDNEFVIDDILVYPQEVSSSTVKTDQKSYMEWLYALDDDTFSKIRMQGHSHGNMGVSPSGVDDTHRQKILDQLEEDMYYIFMIWNRSLSVHTLVYDMAKNILYEDDDVKVMLLNNAEMEEFIMDAKEKVQKPVNKKSIPVEKRQSVFDDNLAGFYESEYYNRYSMYDPYGLGGMAW